MFGPLLFFQVAAAQPHNPTYRSSALAAFVATAAQQNRFPPASLRGYQAHLESELALILRDTLGREDVAQVEQVALRAEWRPDSVYNLHIIGYRSASVGVPYSALSFTRSWTVPSLYGDRLTLGVEVVGRAARQRASSAAERSERERPSRAETPMIAVHPLASDRDRYYRFDGGDTIAFVRSGDRIVPVVRVWVSPVLDSAPKDTTVSVFEGEIDFDAERHQIVRMQGRFVTHEAPNRGLRAKLSQVPGLVAVAFVQFENAEVDGRYWLPAFQRTEFQATLAPLGSQRSVFRLISKFSDMTVDIDHAVSEREDSTRQSARLSSNGSTVGPHGARRTLSYAKGDSVSRYESWQLPLGAATAAVSASDFNDFLPDAWRPYGPPRLEFAPTTFDQLFRFDRVEGAFSGVAIAMRFRDAAPGLSARVFGGWAWAEQAVRGGASVSYTRGNRTVAARAERLLVSTNDFGAPLDAGTIGFGGLFGADDQDYLDRRVAAVDLTNTIGSVHTAILTVDGGLGTDANERVRISHGLFGVGSFRLNRASTDGSYARGAATLELHPDVTGLFLGPGAGLVASYEIGRGELNWQRAELTLSARQNVRDLTIEGRAQGGMVLGRDIPPQQLFELGGEGALPGYQYKQFAGDRAGTGGALLSYTLPLLRRPRRLVRSLVVPGLGPGVAIGIQSGWAEASSERVLAAIRRLDPLAPPNCAANPIAGCPAPLSTPTGGVRSTVDARLTVFGGLLGFGLGRPIDRSARWRFVFRFGPEY